MTSENWRDHWAGAQSRADQELAAIRELEEPMREFMEACINFDTQLREAGIGDKQRISVLVNLALGTGVTG